MTDEERKIHLQDFAEDIKHPQACLCTFMRVNFHDLLSTAKILENSLFYKTISAQFGPLPEFGILIPPKYNCISFKKQFKRVFGFKSN